MEFESATVGVLREDPPPLLSRQHMLHCDCLSIVPFIASSPNQGMILFAHVVCSYPCNSICRLCVYFVIFSTSFCILYDVKQSQLSLNLGPQCARYLSDHLEAPHVPHEEVPGVQRALIDRSIRIL